MSDSPTRVGGTSRLGWQTGAKDRMALGAEPETRRQVETRHVDRPDPGGARRAGSAPGREPERPRERGSAAGGAGVHLDALDPRSGRGWEPPGTYVGPHLAQARGRVGSGCCPDHRRGDHEWRLRTQRLIPGAERGDPCRFDRAASAVVALAQSQVGYSTRAVELVLQQVQRLLGRGHRRPVGAA